MCFSNSLSSSDGPLIDSESFQSTFSKVYPGETIDDLASTISTLSKLVIRCVEDGKNFYEIPKNLSTTRFKQIPGLEELAKNAKIIVLNKSRKKVNIYFTLRGQNEEINNIGGSKKFLKGVEIKLDLINPDNSLIGRFGHLSAKMPNGPGFDKAAKKFRANIDHEIESLERLRGTPGVTTLFDHVRYDRVKNKGTPEETSYTRYRIFEELYDTNLFYLTQAIHLNEELFEDHDKAEVFIQLLLSLRAIERKRFFHGDIKPDNIVVKFDEDKKRFAFCDFGYSSKRKFWRHKFPVRGCTFSYISYEHYRQMMDNPKFYQSKATHGFDLWNLGCSLHELLFGYLNPFSSLLSCGPLINNDFRIIEKWMAKVHLSAHNSTDAGNESPSLQLSGEGQLQNRSLSASHTHEMIEADGIRTKDYNSFSITEYSESDQDGDRTFKEIPEAKFIPSSFPEPSNAEQRLLEKLNCVKRLFKEVIELFDDIDNKRVANLFEKDRYQEVDNFTNKMLELHLEINENLISKFVVDAVSTNDLPREFIEGLQAFELNFGEFIKRYQSMVEKAARRLTKSKPRVDFFECMLQKTLHPDPKWRITAKEALSELKRVFPEVYNSAVNEIKTSR